MEKVRPWCVWPTVGSRTAEEQNRAIHTAAAICITVICGYTIALPHCALRAVVFTLVYQTGAPSTAVCSHDNNDHITAESITAVTACAAATVSRPEHYTDHEKYPRSPRRNEARKKISAIIKYRQIMKHKTAQK